ncbi:MAG: hypothetical protein R3320_04855 [Nitriliruptorales bacterium]|nr:hypothetical protein [Nitriliruptorales bacterium]
MHEALPVEVEIAEPTGPRVRAYLEGTLGWQVVDHGTSKLVPPVCRLVDVGAEAMPGAPPTLLLVTERDDARDAAAAAVRLGPAGIVRWPEEREALPATAEGLATAAPHEHATAGQLRIAGAAGGVGATTVCLAVGGLLAWAGRPALVIARGPVPVPEVRQLSSEDLAGAGTWRGATSVPGCDGLKVVRCNDSTADAPVDAGAVAAAVIRDVGVVDEADVLVMRRDRPGIDALAVTSAGTAIVIDDGVVPVRSFTAAAGRRRLLVLERSVRVARAGALQRVPASLPGSWLRTLRPLAADLLPQSGTRRSAASSQ